MCPLALLGGAWVARGGIGGRSVLPPCPPLTNRHDASHAVDIDPVPLKRAPAREPAPWAPYLPQVGQCQMAVGPMGISDHDANLNHPGPCEPRPSARGVGNIHTFVLPRTSVREGGERGCAPPPPTKTYLGNNERPALSAGRVSPAASVRNPRPRRACTPYAEGTSDAPPATSAPNRT